jgi:hypothetical protein
LLAQFNVRGWLYDALSQAGFPIPLNEMIDLFGWQFLWVAGLALGNARLPSCWPKWVLVACGAVAVALLLCRHMGFDRLTGPALFDLLVDKWRLGILRLIDATALGILLIRFGSSWGNSWLGIQLAMLGRASLEVFSAHLIFCFVFLGMASGPDAHFTVWQDVAIIGITLAGLFGVARNVRKCKVPEGSIGAHPVVAFARRP